MKARCPGTSQGNGRPHDPSCVGEVSSEERISSPEDIPHFLDFPPEPVQWGGRKPTFVHQPVFLMLVWGWEPCP
jgi:hypothetical protein